MPRLMEPWTISIKALAHRINRKLAAQNQKLIKARGERARTEVGTWYVIDPYRNHLVLKYVNPEALGRKLGALQSWEKVARE
jgi:hypothetical protein